MRWCRKYEAMTRRHGTAPGSPLPVPDDQAIAGAAAELNLAIGDKCDELAANLINTLAETSDTASAAPPGAGQTPPRLHRELTKLRIRRAANADLGGAVADARLAGATWEQIGWACGCSKQAAYERWHTIVKKFEAARRATDQPRLDALDQYDPTGAPPPP
ncbi:hypothetical protein NWFMUON74_39950 [Nocardia wallacei]|uniref:Uncharacterized protein n=2 Tax=Nocardia wallacei TaxID=480035 RepID=A0A7G1KPV4_9NOCA|nr:hypothetical protein NWFMUON74_39950 [Nocardia wallacei]